MEKEIARSGGSIFSKYKFKTKNIKYLRKRILQIIEKFMTDNKKFRKLKIFIKLTLYFAALNSLIFENLIGNAFVSIRNTIFKQLLVHIFEYLYDN